MFNFLTRALLGLAVVGCNYTTHVFSTDASTDQVVETDGSLCCPLDQLPIGGCLSCVQNPGGTPRNGQCAMLCGGDGALRVTGYRTDDSGCREVITELASGCGIVPTAESSLVQCSDDVDNDGDRFIDCQDFSCTRPESGASPEAVRFCTESAAQCAGPFDDSCPVGFECAAPNYERCSPIDVASLQEASAAGRGFVNFTDQGISLQGFSTFDESGECPAEGLGGIINLMAINGSDFINHPAYEDLYCQQDLNAFRGRPYSELVGPSVIVRFVPSAGDQTQFRRLTLGSPLACNAPGTVTAEIRTFGPNGTDLGWVPITQGHFEYRSPSMPIDAAIEAFLIGTGQVGEQTVTIRVKFRASRAVYFC